MSGTPFGGIAASRGATLRTAFDLQRSINSSRCSARNSCSIVFTPCRLRASPQYAFCLLSRRLVPSLENYGDVATVRRQVRCGGEQKVRARTRKRRGSTPGTPQRKDSETVDRPPEAPEYPFHDRSIRVTRICIGHRKINLSTVSAGQTV